VPWWPWGELTREGMVLGKGRRAQTLGWAGLEHLSIQGGMCQLFCRGEKQPAARWLFETKNTMPVCMVIERQLLRNAADVHGQPGHFE
jgi:hypothetical protein